VEVEFDFGGLLKPVHVTTQVGSGEQ